jgi:hypothetical protein
MNILTCHVNKGVDITQQKEFGAWLGNLIDTYKLKRREVAEVAEIHHVSLSRIIKGEYGVKRPTAIRLIDAINTVAGREIADKSEGLALAGYSSDEEDIERLELEAMYRKRRRLSAERKEAFRRILDMVDRELDRLIEEEEAKLRAEGSTKMNGNQ